MTKIREIQQKVAETYKEMDDKITSVEYPMVYQTMSWVSFAYDYISAASVVEKASFPLGISLFLPRLQLTGQAVESALKAYIASTGNEPGNSHDLVLLYERVEGYGFSLNEFNQAIIVHLASFYYQDFSTNTKFKTRYPTKSTERLGGAVPEHSSFASLVQLLCEQAQNGYQQSVDLLASKTHEALK